MRSSDRSTYGVNGGVRDRPGRPSKTPGSPRRKLIAWVLPPRSTSTSSRADSALTTRGADAVQAAGRGVGAAAELAAGVQLGHDDLDAGQAGLRLDVDRDAAAVVAHLDRAVGVQDHVDAVAVAAQRLVDGVVDDLPQAVHEAAGVGRPDVHARALADRLEALEDRQVPGGVVPGGTDPAGGARALGMGGLDGHAVMLLTPAPVGRALVRLIEDTVRRGRRPGGHARRTLTAPPRPIRAEPGTGRRRPRPISGDQVRFVAAAPPLRAERTRVVCGTGNW